MLRYLLALLYNILLIVPLPLLYILPPLAPPAATAYDNEQLLGFSEKQKRGCHDSI
jgi:hypothetical protein